MQGWKPHDVLYAVLQLPLQMQKQLLKQQPLAMTTKQKAVITQRPRKVNCRAQLQRGLAMDEEQHLQTKLLIAHRRCSSWWRWRYGARAGG
jgi:hypothetical protein